MSSAPKPWSDNPNAPKIPYILYFDEKCWFAGTLISSILYGIAVILFFQCMAALFNPGHRRGEPVKRGLVSYTVAIFSVVTIQTAMDLDLQSISFIDNREFPGSDLSPPGPIGYQPFISKEALSIIPNALFTLSNWMADGLLLYRCYVVYTMNLWVMAFPCLMYLGSLAMGILLVYQNANIYASDQWASLPYFSIALSLNVILTLMIIIRLILHARNTRAALGGSGIGGLSKAIVTMLVESCALYAVSSLLVIGPYGGGNYVTNLFLFVLPETQVIASLLIIQRVANKSALTSGSLAAGHISEFKARSRGGLTDGSNPIPGGHSMSPVGEREMDSGEPEIAVESRTDVH